MASHARRRSDSATRGVRPLLAVTLGLMPLALGSAGAGLTTATAVADPVNDESDDGYGGYGSRSSHDTYGPYGDDESAAGGSDADEYGSGGYGSGGYGSGEYGSGEYGSGEYGSGEYDDEAGDPESPCAPRVKACARLATSEVWVTDGAGRTLRGPIPMNYGSADEPTPTGTFTVQRMDKYHVSQEFGERRMPYAVFFDGEGRAFHQGDPARQSAGCIRMERADARFLYEHLDIGDTVQIL